MLSVSVFAAGCVICSNSARCGTSFEFNCRKLFANYRTAATKLYNGATPQLFVSAPNFSLSDEGDPSLIAPFAIDNVKDSEGEIRCQKSGSLSTLRVSYEFGSGDFSVTRATLVIKTLLAAISNGNKSFAENQFERLSAQAFESLRVKKIRGDDPPIFGKSDIDFTSHYAGRLVITPEMVTFSISAY